VFFRERYFHDQVSISSSTFCYSATVDIVLHALIRKSLT
jgi:hypothetical protein